MEEEVKGKAKTIDGVATQNGFFWLEVTDEKGWIPEDRPHVRYPKGFKIALTHSKGAELVKKKVGKRVYPQEYPVNQTVTKEYL
jgi:hypothetical protein